MNSNKDDRDENKDKEFQRMIRDIEEMMKESLRDIAKNKIKPGKSYVHGFNINISPDGKAEVNEFGNYPKTPRRRKQPIEKKEPSFDIFESKKEIFLTIQIPGHKKEDIDLNIVNENLIIDIYSHEKYYKKIKLPSMVKPKTTKATYKNGVLDITLQKKNKNKQEKGYSIDVN